MHRRSTGGRNGKTAAIGSCARLASRGESGTALKRPARPVGLTGQTPGKRPDFQGIAEINRRADQPENA
jgi:hypothetical protein